MNPANFGSDRTNAFQYIVRSFLKTCIHSLSTFFHIGISDARGASLIKRYHVPLCFTVQVSFRQNLLTYPCVLRGPQTGVRVAKESMIVNVRLLRPEFFRYEKVQQETVLVCLELQRFLCPFLF